MLNFLLSYRNSPTFILMRVRTLAFLLITGYSFYAFGQVTFKGKLTDPESKNPLPYVNIGISGKNIGAISGEDGAFSITIPQDNLADTLTFSLIGYNELKVPVNELDPKNEASIQLVEKVTGLNEVLVRGQKLVERKYGIKKTGLILRFADGMFKEGDSFEIGQVIDLGNRPAKLSSLYLHLNSSRKDSASFRINFYRYDENRNAPTVRVFDKSIIQRHPIRIGWLKFDLSDYDVRLKGKVFAAVEFIPENKDVDKILYEVKIGGSSKSFFRRSSLGQWVRPPHHYCLYVTALTDKDAPDEPDDAETPPAFVLKSGFSKEPFSIFVRLPENYSKNKEKTYPVIYHLDGNAFFDPFSGSVDLLLKKKKIKKDPILVGIGYENAWLMDSLRTRDYTFPASSPADGFGISGNGADFYDFIKEKVIPRIDSAYRTEKADRTIMGHSFGGYFVLYSLLRHPTDRSVFHNYIAASPSLSYHNDYLITQFGKLNSDLDNARLYLTIGEPEISNSKTNSFNTISRVFATRNFYKMKPKVYKGLEHMGTAIPSFEDGIEFIFGK